MQKSKYEKSGAVKPELDAHNLEIGRQSCVIDQKVLYTLLKNQVIELLNQSLDVTASDQIVHNVTDRTNDTSNKDVKTSDTIGANSGCTGNDIAQKHKPSWCYS